MRYLRELAVFGAWASAAFLILFCLAWAVGSPFGLDARRAAWLAVVFLSFWLPGLANLYIAVTGSALRGGEWPCSRVLAGVRAFGILLCSATLTVPLVAPGLFLPYGILFGVVGMVLAWCTLFLEHRRA